MPPPEPRRAENPLDFRPGLALSRGMNIGMDLCTPEGTRNLMRQTTQIMASIDRSIRPGGITTPAGLSAAVRAGMQHIAAHKGDVVAALASLKAEGAEGHWAAPAQSPRAGEQSRTGITHKTAAETMWPYMEPAEAARAVVSTLAESDRQALYQLVASGDLKCQGFAGGCQNGGSFGLTSAYVVRGRILCRTCATRALGYTEEPGSELPSLLAPYALYPQ